MRGFGRGIERTCGAGGEVRPRVPRQQRFRHSGAGNPRPHRWYTLLAVAAVHFFTATATVAATTPITLTVPKDLLYTLASDSQGKKSDEIRRRILENNPDLVAFETTRSGDEIHVQIGWQQGPDRADFRLIGLKHDIYRMSMGVRLEETLAALAEADPNIASVGVEKAGERLYLSLLYTWPPGTGPTVATSPPPPPQTSAPKPTPSPVAAKPVPPPAPAPPAKSEASVAEKPPLSKYFVPARSDPPPGAEAEVVVPTPGQSPPAAPTPAVVSESKAAVPAAEPPAAAKTHDSATEVEREYQKALEDGTFATLARFAAAYPNTSQGERARERADRLREEQAYRKALERNDEAGYRGYLENFPTSARRPEVEAKLRTLDEDRKQDEARRRTQAIDEKRRMASYDEARKLDTVEAYRIFLTAYPNTAEAAEAKQHIAAIEGDDAAYRKARSSEEGLEQYLGIYPEGRNAGAARRELQILRGARLDADYRAAVTRNTAESYRRFLEVWPRSPKASEARAALERLEARTAAAPVPEPPPSTPSGRGTSPRSVLNAPWVPTPPAVDGNAGDDTWARAAELEVPLQSNGQAAGTLRVRAVHDGQHVYVLVRWPDRTRDTLYRPWVWDITRRTYRQDDQLDDGLAVMWYGADAPDDSCMLQPIDHVADTWMWRAQWSEISGIADDGQLRISRQRLPQSNPYAAGHGEGQTWIRKESDEGAPGWAFFIPVEFQGAVVASYKLNRARGSRGDVAARGTWSGDGETGAWTVEFSRALDTRNSDDVALRVATRQPFALAVYDKTEKGRHASSPMLQLQLQEK